jgi:hypothetical protein
VDAQRKLFRDKFAVLLLVIMILSPVFVIAGQVASDPRGNASLQFSANSQLPNQENFGRASFNGNAQLPNPKSNPSVSLCVGVTLTSSKVNTCPVKTVISTHFSVPPGWKAGVSQLSANDADTQKIQAARDIGARYVRFDIWWDQIEPQIGLFSANATDYFQQILQKIHSYGLQPIAIVGTAQSGLPTSPSTTATGATSSIDCSKVPSGFFNGLFLSVFSQQCSIPVGNSHSLAVRGGRVSGAVQQLAPVGIQLPVTDAFLAAASDYTQYIGSHYGSLIDYYQLGNELNNPLINTPRMLDSPFYINALYQGLARSDPSFQTIVNVDVDNAFSETIPSVFNWEVALSLELAGAGGDINIIAIDHYPGTWSFESYNDWHELDILFGLADSAGKQAAVMETGYSTCSPFPLSIVVCLSFPTNNQLDFANSALTTIRQKAQVHPLSFVTWYELLDEPLAARAIERHFGILYLDFSQKIGYSTLRQHFLSFGGS